MRIALLPGDGIGPEVIASAEAVLRSLVPAVETAAYPIGFGAFESHGTPLPEETLTAVREADATLLGAVTTPVNIPNYRSPILELRQRLELFANLRPVCSMGLAGTRAGVDIMLVRENSEGLYSGREHLSPDGELAIAERVVSRTASERIVRYACEIAKQRSGRVTAVHKANVLRETCGLFLRSAQHVAGDDPDIQLDDMLVDACAMRLLREPEAFDVIVTTNLFGDILSDEACELVGGLGVAASANIGADCAVFEPVHGSAPDIAGTGKANPFATLGALEMLLNHVGLGEAAQRLNEALAWSLDHGAVTLDLGGTMSTQEVTQALLQRLEETERRGTRTA